MSIVTSHHDPNHCFEETSLSGDLYSSIKVIGDFLPRTLFGGRFTALCGIVRMVYMSIIHVFEICLGGASKFNTDVFILDGISFPVPLLRLTGAPILFYCHFPDKVFCVKRGGDMYWMWAYSILMSLL